MKTVLDLLREYEVELDKEINNVENMSSVTEMTRMQLFFIYSVLANCRDMDTVEVSEIKRVAIDKLYYLYSNRVKLRLEEINLTFLQIFETYPPAKSILKNKLLNYLTQAADFLLKGSTDAWAASSRREVDKIISSCVDVVFEEIKQKRRK